MEKRGNTKLVIGIVVIVAIALIVATGFRQPNIIKLVHTDNTLCPDTLGSEFELGYLNDLNRPASLCVEVSSSDVVFEQTKQCISIPGRRNAKVSFPIKESSLPAKDEEAKITISYSDYGADDELISSTTCDYYKRVNSEDILLNN